MADIPLIRNSERTDFMRCRQRWVWAYVDRLKPKETSSPLVFGDLVHQALAAFYKPETTPRKRGVRFRGPDPSITFNQLYDEMEDRGEAFNVKSGADDDDEKWGDARTLGTVMLNGYIDKYGLDDQYTIMIPEMPFKLPIVDPDTKKVLCYAVGTSDAVVEDNETGLLGLFEHKTAAHIVTSHLSMDEQASTYYAFVPPFLKQQGLMPKDEKLDFILFNFLRKGYPDDRPINEYGQHLNKDGTVSKRQPPPLFQRKLVYREAYESKQFIQRFIQQAREMNAIRTGRAPAHKSPLNGCTGMLGCTYRDMCELHETGMDWEQFRNLTMTTWEPYDNQRGMR